MQLSTDLPSELKAIKKYFANRGETNLPMNVSKEADAAFVSELRRTDLARYARLRKTLDIAGYAAQRAAWVEARRCEHCNLVLPLDIRSDAQFCDRTCQRASRQSRMAA